MKIYPYNNIFEQEEESKDSGENVENMCLGWFMTKMDDADELQPITNAKRHFNSTEHHHNISTTTSLLHDLKKNKKNSILDIDCVNVLSDENERDRVYHEFYKGTVVAENSGKARLNKMCDEIKSATYNDENVVLPSVSAASHQFQL